VARFPSDTRRHLYLIAENIVQCSGERTIDIFENARHGFYSTGTEKKCHMYEASLLDRGGVFTLRTEADRVFEKKIKKKSSRQSASSRSKHLF
jgi:hypothetical protein